MTHPLPSTPPGLEATLMPNPGPGEVHVAAAAPRAAPRAALSEIVEPQFWQAPIPGMETSSQ